MAEDVKAWYKSKTIQSAIAQALVNLYEYVVVPLSASFGLNLPAVPGMAMMILNGILGTTIVYGRATATQTLK